MSLADRIKSATPEPTITLKAWLATLSTTDLAAVDDMKLNPAWSNAAICRFLHDEGVSVGKDTVAVWRRAP